MSVTIRGTDSSSSTPAFTGTDGDTGLYFPAANQLALATNGTQAVFVNSSQQVGIGTSSPGAALEIGGTNPSIYFGNAGSASGGYIGYSTANNYLGINAVTQGVGYRPIAIGSDGGNVGIGTTSPQYKLDIRGSTIFAGNGSASAGNEYTFINGGDRYILTHGTSLNTATQMYFTNPNGTVGSISTSGSSTSYNTSSDYRLKENVEPMTGALEKVSLLKPVKYKWKTDGTDGEGFLAHELQAVLPIAVYGEKDAVEDYGDVLDSEGNIKYPDVRTPTTPEEGTTFVKKGERPVYQSVDTSFLVATLTAAIQELNAKVVSLEEQVLNLGVK